LEYGVDIGESRGETTCRARDGHKQPRTNLSEKTPGKERNFVAPGPESVHTPVKTKTISLNDWGAKRKKVGAQAACIRNVELVIGKGETKTKFRIRTIRNLKGGMAEMVENLRFHYEGIAGNNRCLGPGTVIRRQS